MFSWMLESALGLGPLLSWVPDSGLAFPKKQDRGWAENGGPWAKGLGLGGRCQWGTFHPRPSTWEHGQGSGASSSHHRVFIAQGVQAPGTRLPT